MEEIWVRDILLAFDGRVVEVFGFPGSESLRFHIGNLRLEVNGPDRKGRYMIQMKPASRGSGGCAFEVGPDEWPEAGPFFDAIRTAIPEPT